MRRIVVLALVALVTGCGSAGTAAHSPTPAPASSGGSNAQSFVDGLASGSKATISSLRSSVSGPVMPSYVRLLELESAALAAEGQPAPMGSVTHITNGFRICWAGGQGCQSFTSFRLDAAGHITDLALDGQLISGRMAIGTSGTGSGLAISSVCAYLSTKSGTVDVLFVVRNIGQRTVGQVNPAFLPVFTTSDGNQIFYHNGGSVLPGPLKPGESTAAIAVFDTRSIAGQFSLHKNIQGEQVLVTSQIHQLSPGTSSTG